MESFAQLARRVTHRLAPDPVLRLDVEREIRCHLDDAFAANRSGGHPESEAASEALRAIGDETELSESLWQANRRRMRVRAWCRWAAQVLLVPAAIVVTVVLLPWWRGGSGVRSSLSNLQWTSSGNGITGEDIALIGLRSLGGIADFPVHSFRAEREAQGIHIPRVRGLGKEERALLACNLASYSIPSAKLLVDAHPADPVFRATYTRTVVGSLQPNRGETRSSPGIVRRLAVLDEAERAEPDNGMYNVLRAASLASVAARPEDDGPRQFSCEDRSGRIINKNCQTLVVHDEAVLDEAMAELLRGMAKPRFTRYVRAMANRRMDVLPKETTIDQLVRLWAETSTCVPDLLEYRFLVSVASARGLEMAVKGRGEDAMQLLEAGALLSARLGQDSIYAVELLVAIDMRLQSQGHKVVACRELGWRDGQTKAQDALDRDARVNSQAYKGYWSQRDPNARKYEGILSRHLTNRLPGDQIDPGPLRMAENAMAGSIFIQVILVVMDMILVCAAALAAGLWLRHRTGDGRPVQVFVGWRRMANILLLSVLAPLVIYGVYAYLTPWGGKQYGLSVRFERMAAELTLILIMVTSLLVVSTRRAIHARLQEAGFSVPPVAHRRRRVVTVAGFLAVSFSVYIVMWNVRVGADARPYTYGWPLPGFGAAWMLLAVGAWLFWACDRGRAFLRLGRLNPGYVGSVARSMVPVAAGAVVLASVLAGGTCALVERAAIARLQLDTNVFSLTNEIDGSRLRNIRDYLAQEARTPIPDGP